MYSGVDMLYDKCVELGFTPVDRTPTEVAKTISEIYNKRYTVGRESKRCVYGTFSASGKINLGWTPKAAAVIAAGPQGYGGGWHCLATGTKQALWANGVGQGGPSSSGYINIYEGGIEVGFYGNPRENGGYYIATE